jgi:hypothetical protein
MEAARAYDAALVRLRGNAAFTNFALAEYSRDLAAYQQIRQVFPTDVANGFTCGSVMSIGVQKWSCGIWSTRTGLCICVVCPHCY